ncbi:hypothetical protein [Streptacidiphilus rugosus]|uniref:hypothetical protein n=1 Tax=Streptacidiphilus rugosus TaxID=405783 RepID=UPI0005608831|nr:hypothetical protein [Streptacidiphilus rugosus]
MTTVAPAKPCGVTETLRLLRAQACDCSGDLPRIADALADLSRPGAFDTVVRWATQSQARGRCRHADAAARLLIAAMAAYPGDFEAHAAGTARVTGPLSTGGVRS